MHTNAAPTVTTATKPSVRTKEVLLVRFGGVGVGRGVGEAVTAEVTGVGEAVGEAVGDDGVGATG